MLHAVQLRVNWQIEEIRQNDVKWSPSLRSAPLEEVVPSSVSVDGGETLQAAGDVRGKRRLADVLKALQLTDQNPVGKQWQILSNCTEIS